MMSPFRHNHESNESIAYDQARRQISNLVESQDPDRDLIEDSHAAFKPFLFLNLPPEIREKIYQYYYAASSNQFTDSSNYVSLFIAAREFPTALLMTCFQIYSESRHYYFSINSFAITIQRGNFNEQFNWFLTPEFRDNRLLIPSLRLTIDRWGTASWFLSTFLPCLDDMLLNGRLRELEVRLPNTIARNHGNYYPPNNEMTLELKRLCEDPYLTNVVVKTYDREQLRKLRQPLFDIGDIWLTDISWQLDRPKIQDGTGTWPWTSGVAESRLFLIAVWQVTTVGGLIKIDYPFQWCSHTGVTCGPRFITRGIYFSFQDAKKRASYIKDCILYRGRVECQETEEEPQGEPFHPCADFWDLNHRYDPRHWIWSMTQTITEDKFDSRYGITCYISRLQVDAPGCAQARSHWDGTIDDILDESYDSMPCRVCKRDERSHDKIPRTPYTYDPITKDFHYCESSDLSSSDTNTEMGFGEDTEMESEFDDGADDDDDFMEGELEEQDATEGESEEEGEDEEAEGDEEMNDVEVYVKEKENCDDDFGYA